MLKRGRLAQAAVVEANTQLNLCAVLSELGRHGEALQAARAATGLLQPLQAGDAYLDAMPLAKMVEMAEYNLAACTSAAEDEEAASSFGAKPTKDGDRRVDRRGARRKPMKPS